MNIPKKIPSVSDLKDMAKKEAAERAGKFLNSNLGKLDTVKLMDADPKKLIDSLPKTKDLFNNPMKQIQDQVVSPTKGIMESAEKSLKDYSGFAEGLSGQASGAVQQATTFLTNTSMESVLPFEMPSISGLGLGNIGKGALDRISKFSGLDKITSSSGLNKALGKINDQFSGAGNIASAFVNSMGLGDSPLIGGLKDTARLVSDQFNLNEALGGVTSQLSPDIINSISQLPGGIQRDLSDKYNLGGINLGSSNIGTQLGGNYPTVTDEYGDPFPGISDTSRISASEARSLKTLAEEMCPDMSGLFDDILDFANLKDLYDYLLDMAANNGMTSLLKALLECGEDLYSDGRSYEILANNAQRAADRGDIDMLASLSETLGAEGIRDPIRTIRSVASNMESSSSNIDKLKRLCNQLNVSPSEVYRNRSNTNHFSAPAIAQSSFKSKNVVDSLLGSSDKTNTAIAVLSKYGQTNNLMLPI